jgi:hypothetical protein
MTIESSVGQTRQTRKPLMPSSIVTLVTTGIFKRLVIAAIVARAAFSSMQGTKKEVPRRNLDQSI